MDNRSDNFIVRTLIEWQWQEYEKQKQWRTLVAYTVISLACLAFWVCIGLLMVSCAHAEDVDMQVIAQIESSNNPLAHNNYSDAKGLYQIVPICLKDFNLEHEVHYTSEQLFVPEVNYTIARWYLYKRIPQLLKHAGIQPDTDKVLWAYNCGIRCVVDVKLPNETKQYIAKYHQLKGD